MKRDCGKKCFLGPGKSFPVCAGGTCDVNTKGAYAAYIRAKQWGKSSKSYRGKARPTRKRRVYAEVARKALAILRRRSQGSNSRTKKYARRSRRTK